MVLLYMYNVYTSIIVKMNFSIVQLGLSVQ